MDEEETFCDWAVTRATRASREQVMGLFRYRGGAGWLWEVLERRSKQSVCSEG